MIEATPWAIPALVSFILTGAAFFTSLSMTKTMRNGLLQLLMLWVSLWSLAHFIRVIGATPELKLIGHAPLLGLALLLAVTYLLLALLTCFNQKTMVRPVAAIALLIASASLLLVLNEGTRHLIMASFGVDDDAGFHRVSVVLAPGGQAIFAIAVLSVIAGATTFLIHAIIEPVNRQQFVIFGCLGVGLLLAQQISRELWINQVTAENLAPVATSMLMLGIVASTRIFENKLRRQASMLVLQILPDALFFTDAQGLIVDTNLKAETLFNREKGTLNGLRLFDLIGLEPGSEVTGKQEDVRLKKLNPETRFDIVLDKMAKQDGQTLFYSCLLEDRTEFRNNLDELRNFNDQLLVEATALEQTGKNKRRFLVQCGNTLGGPLEQMLESIRDLQKLLGEEAPVASEFTVDMTNGASHLLQLVNQIKVFDRTGLELEIHLEPVSMAPLIQQIGKQFMPQCLVKNIQLEIHTDHAEEEFMADSQKIRQILTNLVSNAIKFTLPGGSITISASISAATSGTSPTGLNEKILTVSVTDTGIGIDKANLAMVFKPFHQVDDSYSRNQGGTGLGLALVQRFVNAHGGTISAESTPNIGTTFTFNLPSRHAT